MVTQIKRKARLSVTVAPELKAFAEDIAKKTNTTPSGIVSQCLKDLAHNHKEKLMIEYYEAMAKENDEYAEKSIKVINKIASSWRD
jgi:predicted transcriptional regulator